MNNGSNDCKIGCISAWHTITLTGIFLLIWAFGSYFIYTFTTKEPDLCFPPFSGCLSISRAGNFPISGLFYRMLVLPLAPLLGLSMYFMIQFFRNIEYDMHLITKRILFIIGCIILPIALIITQSFKDGHQIHPSYVSTLHGIFATIAFVALILFQIIASFQLLKRKKILFYKFMFFLSVVPIIISIIQLLTNIENMNNIVEWNIFIVVIIWNTLIGIRIKNHS